MCAPAGPSVPPQLVEGVEKEPDRIAGLVNAVAGQQRQHAPARSDGVVDWCPRQMRCRS